MTHPEVTCHIAGEEAPVDGESELWNAPIPMDRSHSDAGDAVAISYGEYFRSVSTFLSQEGFKVVTGALSEILARRIAEGDIGAIRICLEKHGQFYHPGRVSVAVSGQTVSLVVNVAVSEAGRNCIEREYGVLEKLAKKFPGPHIPKVYGFGQIPLKGGAPVRMFLGEWFEDYHEFHISEAGKADRGIIVWDTAGSDFWLDEVQTLELYRQVAMIMTCYYDPETFDQILPWHHAAGDFILRRDGEEIALRLITVRHHACLVEPSEVDMHSLLEALLLFFINLSIRTRLDRLDGIHDTVWADDIAVEGTVTGFLEALALKEQPEVLPISLSEGFNAYLSAIGREEFCGMAEAVADSYNPDAPDVPVVKANLSAHLDRLCELLGL